MAKWPVPRLHCSEVAHPGIAGRLSHIAASGDFRRGLMDLASQRGDGHRSGREPCRLLPHILQPVCSPRLLEAKPSLRGPDDLTGHRMLVSRYRRDDWRD